MSAIDDAFASLRAAGKKALIPFVTAGDPDLDFTMQVVRRLSQGGATLIEIGIPYSDPIADGPIIQASYTRALRNKIKLREIFDAVRASADIKTPLVCMVSYAIVLRHGLDQFVADAKQAGFAGAIVPDLLLEESSRLGAICAQRDFSLIQLVTPTTPRPRAVQIAKASTGFAYYVSVAGITGERTALPKSLADDVSWLRQQTKTPVCIGFGINSPQHVAMLAPVADGLIVGSAFVKRVAEASQRPRAEVLDEIGTYADSLLAALPK